MLGSCWLGGSAESQEQHGGDGEGPALKLTKNSLPFAMDRSVSHLWKAQNLPRYCWGNDFVRFLIELDRRGQMMSQPNSSSF